MSESKTTTIGSDSSVKTKAKTEMSLPEQNNSKDCLLLRPQSRIQYDRGVVGQWWDAEEF